MLPRHRPHTPPDRTPWSSFAGLAVLVAPLALPLAAMAHPGPGGDAVHGLADGILHPFTGLDHLAAMLAVGAWTGRAPARRWPAPVAFALALVAGSLLAARGLAPPAIEPMIAASVLVFGLLLASRHEIGVGVAAPLVGAFGLFHGAAHGLELGAAPALAGMLVGSVALQAAGVALGLGLARTRPMWTRAAGVLVAGIGGVLMLLLQVA
jgi:urease accessory protein